MLNLRIIRFSDDLCSVSCPDLETVIHPCRISTRRAGHGVGTPIFLIEQIADGESEVQIFAVPAEHGVGADEAGKRGGCFLARIVAVAFARTGYADFAVEVFSRRVTEKQVAGNVAGVFQMDAHAVWIFLVFNHFRLHHAQRSAQVEFFGDDLSDGGQLHAARTVFAADSPSVGIILRVGTVADIEAFDLVGGQCGAEAVVQPAAFDAGFVLAGVLGVGVEHGGRRSVDTQIAAASAIRREAFVI